MNKQRFAAVVAGTVVFLSMLVINVFQIGGRSLITSVNNLMMLGFGVLATAQALIYWRSFENPEEDKRVWLIFGLGMGFYSLGQLTWMAYNLIGIDVPYPSVGDLFWMLAYPFLLISIVNKIRLLGVKPDKSQIAAGAVLGVIFFLLIGDLILLPMLEYVQTARLVETLLNFFYPIMDFLILVAVSFLVIILWKGKLSLSWNIIAAGFLFLAVADVLFIYATWNELYYVEGSSINVLTRSIDVIYTLAISLFALGAYLHQWAATIQPETIEYGFTQTMLAEQSKPQPKPFTTEMQAILNKVFFMVDDNQNIYFFSHHYRELCQMLGSTALIVGSPLHLALGLEKQTVKNVFSGIQPGKPSVVPVEILIGTTIIPAVLRATPARNGCDIFLQYRHKDTSIVVEDQKSIETILVEETLQSVQGLKSSSPDLRGATAFFLIEVQEIYLFLVRMGGNRVGQVLVERFNREATVQNAGVKIIDGRVVQKDVLDTTKMSILLQLTLRTVKELTSPEATSKVVKHLNEKIPEGIIRSAQNVGLAL